MYIKKLLTGFELVGWLKRSFPRHQLERERKITINNTGMKENITG